MDVSAFFKISTGSTPQTKSILKPKTPLKLNTETPSRQVKFQSGRKSLKRKQKTPSHSCKKLKFTPQKETNSDSDKVSLNEEHIPLPDLLTDSSPSLVASLVFVSTSLTCSVLSFFVTVINSPIFLFMAI